jgi:hypothetical protein
LSFSEKERQADYETWHVGLDRLGALQQWKEKGDEKEKKKKKKGKRVPKKLKRARGGEKVQKLDGCRLSFFALFIPTPSSSPLLSSQCQC